MAKLGFADLPSRMNLKMRGRLLLALLVMALLPALIIGALAYQNARITIEQRLYEELNSVADLKKDEIANWVNLIRSDARLLADNFLNEEHITTILDESADPALRESFGNFLTQNLLSLQQTREGYEELMFVDMKGRIILSTNSSKVGSLIDPNIEVMEAFNGQSREHVQDVYLYDDAFEMTFSHVLNKVDAVNMRTTEEAIAAVVIRVDLQSSLFKILEHWPGKGETGELLLISIDEMPYQYVSPLRFIENGMLSMAVPQGINMDTSDGVRNDGDIAHVIDYREMEVVRAYREIEIPGWGFITKQDQAEVFAPITNLTRIWILVSVLTFGAAIALAAYLARNLSEPLQALTSAARRVESGDFDAQVHLDRTDEFGELSGAFNSMVNAVRSNTEKIRKNAEEMQALLNLSDGFLRSVSVTSTLESALKEAISATQAEAGAAILGSEVAGEFSIEAQIGLSANIVGNRFPVDQLTAPGYVMLHRKAAASEDVLMEERFRVPPVITELGVKSNLAVPMEIEDRVIGAIVMDTFEQYAFTQDEIDVVQAIANQTAVAIERIKLIDDLSHSYDRTLAALVAALDARDRETEGHSERVMAYTKAIAKKMNFSNGEMLDLGRGALLHDIGKIGVPDGILHKPGKLDEDEWAIIKKHPEWGQQIIEGIPFLEVPSNMVYSHHERWDGGGYPAGLIGEDIPVGARIFSIVDAFDAMTSDRPYRKALSYEQAIDEIIRGQGTQFDPDIVDIFLEFSKEDWLRIRQEALMSQGVADEMPVFDLQGSSKSQTGQLNALAAIIGAISSSLDMKDVMENTLEALVSMTQASAAGIFLYESGLERLKYVADHDFPKELILHLDKRPTADYSLWASMLDGKTEYFDDISKVEAFEKMRLSEIRPAWASHMCVPLSEKNRVVGIMALFSSKPAVFSADDQALFEGVGKQLARSIMNVQTHEEVRNQAFTDALTGAYNRHFLNDFLGLELKRSQRYQRPLSVIMMDVDFFKKCNDQAGHQAGDKVLIDVVQLLNLGVRTVDMVARYGGEEFIVVLPETNAEGAVEAGERMRMLIENHDFACGKLTASFGLATTNVSESEDLSAEMLIDRADQALISAKRGGRNQLAVWREDLYK